MWSRTQDGWAFCNKHLSPCPVSRFIADTVSWGAIGARTTESQVHPPIVQPMRAFCVPLSSHTFTIWPHSQETPFQYYPSFMALPPGASMTPAPLATFHPCQPATHSPPLDASLPLYYDQTGKKQPSTLGTGPWGLVGPRS